MNFATLWLYLTSHRIAALLLLIGVLLFGTGFQLGRVTSPYYAAHPIVFKESSDVSLDSGGDTAQLAHLREEGSAKTAQAEGTDVVSSAAPEPTVAAKEQVAAATTSAAPGEGLFVGSKNSDKYHHKSCSTWGQIKPENRVWFSTKEEAEAAGYTPTKCTMEILGQP